MGMKKLRMMYLINHCQEEFCSGKFDKRSVIILFQLIAFFTASNKGGAGEVFRKVSSEAIMPNRNSEEVPVESE